MKVSKKKLAELYSAVRDPIVDLRIKRSRTSSTTASNPPLLITDADMFSLELEIWRRIEAALKPSTHSKKAK